MYLFDTDALTAILKPKPPQGLLERLSKLEPSSQFTSTITISEIVYGACKSDRKEYHLRNLQEVLLPAVNILDFDAKSAYIAGEIRAQLEKGGQPLALADLQIASIAIANDLTLITGNVKHFQRIKKLSLENWLA